MNDTIQTKRCPKCGRILPLNEFSKKKSSKDGRQSFCKQCVKAYDAEYRAKNKDAIAQKHADYYQSNKDAILQKKAEYRANNKEAIAQRNSKWYANNKEKIADYYNPQTHPMNWAHRIVGRYRQADRDRCFDDSKTISAEWFLENIMYNPCAHCGLLQAGAIGANRLNNNIGHEASNLEPCCRNCNSRLGAIDQIARGVHISQVRKKQSFKDFVEEHKAKDKNSQ